MAAKVTFEQVEQLILAWFPDPEPETPSVRGFRAIATLLLSAAVLGTVKPSELHRFTGYHPAFIASVAWNMRNNGLWTAQGYDASHWLSSAGEVDEHMFLTDFDIASGSTWCPDAEFLHHAIDSWDVYHQLEPVATAAAPPRG